jgi:hypothetical protein
MHANANEQKAVNNLCDRLISEMSDADPAIQIKALFAALSETISSRRDPVNAEKVKLALLDVRDGLRVS